MLVDHRDSGQKPDQGRTSPVAVRRLATGSTPPNVGTCKRLHAAGALLRRVDSRQKLATQAILVQAVRLLAIGFLLSGPLPQSARAQLISPGKLTAAHADLEGITNCTNCHSLGQKGISIPKCLDCHEVVKELIDGGKGYHATNSRQSCASCHKEHFGRDFDTIHLDTLTFRHNDTGYPLIASHREAACSSCHTSKFITAPSVLAAKKSQAELDKTYLGLPSTCSTCHADQNVHGEQFAPKDCASCHLEREFEEAPLFEHDQTAFPLTGQHQTVDCEGCHKPSELFASSGTDDVIEYVGVDFATCLSCHDDNHDGSMGANCTSCHNTGGWNRINAASFERTFDHDATSFTLVGKHEALACTSCHGKPAQKTEYIAISFQRGTRGKAYPHPEASQCQSCHVDYHDGVFTDNVDGAECTSCHNENGWQPSSFDIDRHNEQSRFELTGAHLATPCVACHENPTLGHIGPEFQFERLDCESCHEADSKHKSQFADTLGITTCENCHVTEVWTDVTFDHETTKFPLLGAHAAQTCESCHTNSSRLQLDFEVYADSTTIHYTGLDFACATCHSDDDPHEGQFNEATCNTCHDEVSFLIAAFDHDSTNFPLTGGHETVACVSCHKSETSAEGNTFARFKPLGTQCEDCHDSKR